MTDVQDTRPASLQIQGDVRTPTGDALYDRYAAALVGERLPSAFVDLDRFDANRRRLEARAGGLPIRLVTKSVRCVTLLRHVLETSNAFRGLLCFSPGEAAWLAELGFDDLVVAYPSVEPSELRQVARWVAAGRQIVLMVDDEAQLPAIERAGKTSGAVMPVAIDIDASSAGLGFRFGVYRSPIAGPDAALALAQAISRSDTVRLTGLMGYEGQIAGLMDDVPGNAVRNRTVRWLKRRSAAAVNSRRRAIVEALRAAGHDLLCVNGGGTGSFETTRLDASVTELAAGSGLYVPALFDHYRAFTAEPAAGFALPVTRYPAPGIVTCAGGGYCASGPAGSDRLPSPWLPSGVRLLPLEGGGEVQTPLRLPRDVPPPPPGAPIFFRHAKAGELCERFEQLLLIRDGRIVDRVNTYRGDGRCFM